MSYLHVPSSEGGHGSIDLSLTFASSDSFFNQSVGNGRVRAQGREIIGERNS